MTDARKEIWKPVAGYEGLYQVSDAGKVRSKRCDLSPMITKKGYSRVSLYKNKKLKSKSVHSLVMEGFIGERPDGYHIEHVNHDKTNNSVSNLRYCTATENAHRNVIDGKQVNGERHGRHILTLDMVRKIKNTVGISNRKIGKIYGVSGTTINDIKKGKYWAQSLAVHRETEKALTQPGEKS